MILYMIIGAAIGLIGVNLDGGEAAVAVIAGVVEVAGVAAIPASVKEEEMTQWDDSKAGTIEVGNGGLDGLVA